MRRSAMVVRHIRRTLVYSALVLTSLWVLFPFWSAFTLSLKHQGDFFAPRFVPFLQFQPTLNNWLDEWYSFGYAAGLGRGLVNSLIVATATSALSLALGLLAAFGLLLLRRQRGVWWCLIGLLLLPRLVPPVATVFPFVAMMRWLGLTDTLLATVIAHTTLAMPLAVVILHGVLLDLRGDLLDAAQVDGCGPLAALGWVVVPLVLPALLAAGALCFAQSWNEFLYAVTNAQQWARTAPLSIASLITKDGIEFEYVGSHLLLVMLPPPLLALLARRYIVRGLTLGMVKG